MGTRPMLLVRWRRVSLSCFGGSSGWSSHSSQVPGEGKRESMYVCLVYIIFGQSHTLCWSFGYPCRQQWVARVTRFIFYIVDDIGVRRTPAFARRMQLFSDLNQEIEGCSVCLIFAQFNQLLVPDFFVL